MLYYPYQQLRFGTFFASILKPSNETILPSSHSYLIKVKTRAGYGLFTRIKFITVMKSVITNYNAFLHVCQI